MNTHLKLDIFPHIFPEEFFEHIKNLASRNASLAAQIKRWLHIPVLWDLDARMKMMDRFEGFLNRIGFKEPEETIEEER